MRFLSEFLQITDDGTLRIPKRILEKYGIKKVFIGSGNPDKTIEV
ncbi:hypothetical protein [Archaeoglobus veneficus]|uniref:Uncharacterized protein n=1 Tax=Archaeoglobus veneficus (strain DSM 11195 / SNP6) TaxID=693661 RepID=F2KSI6_ARCVS|nr:hypothetical protein [Archaeoglobus veneficus]AEA48056.1 hypothetical protein Arcve_2066 [Archaeoglobus veneficus SNP6]